MCGRNPLQACCQEEFQLSRFGLDHPDPQIFVSPQWQRPSFTYALYRTLSALYFLILFVLSWTHYGPKDGWSQLSFLTEWSFDILTCSFFLRAVLSCYVYQKQYRNGFCPVFVEMHWSLKLSWVIYNVSSCVAVSLTLFYWIILFNPDKNDSKLEWVLDIHRHVLQSVFVLIDLSITAMPIRLLHIFHSWIYGLIYALFNIAYVMIPPGNPPVYDDLDWRNSTGLALGMSLGFALFGMTGVWAGLFGLFKLRLYVHAALLRNSKEPEPVDKNSATERQNSYQQDMDVGLISETSLNY